MLPVMTITVRNVNDALPIAATLFRDPTSYRRIAPRTGQVTLEYCAPVVTTFKHPLERVLFSPTRDANPFFHFFEALWILAGRYDVRWLEFFLPRIKDYSDDGKYFHGAYGARLREVPVWNGETDSFDDIDQLTSVIEQLKADKDSRRAVAAIWQPDVDTGYSGKDMPCNCTLAFKIRDGALNLSVFNRSNDVVWGAYGANAVQFATVLEYVAGMLGVPAGTYFHWSDSFHVYENEQWERVRNLDHKTRLDAYVEAPCWVWEDHAKNFIKPVQPYPLVKVPEIFDSELHHFVNSVSGVIPGGQRQLPLAMDHQSYENPYFDEVALPMLNAFLAYKRGDFQAALEWALNCVADDWSLAATMWLHRRGEARNVV